ncbi:MAG: hypothetical protein WBV94_20440 [Blastocatellia bacterium]
MNAELLKIVGQVAGIGGIAIGMFLILFRDVIRKNIFPNLTKDQAYRLLRLIVVLVWSVAIIGIAAWYATTAANKHNGNDPKTASPDASFDSTKESEMTGQVRDETSGLPNVDILDINSGARTTSNSGGTFTLKVKETSKGWARVQVSKEGYEIWEEYVETKSGLIILLRRKQK